jgi:hypothetical protein
LFTHSEENFSIAKLPYLCKKQWENMKTNMVEEPSHVKHLALNHVCKIGLKLRIRCEIRVVGRGEGAVLLPPPCIPF